MTLTRGDEDFLKSLQCASSKMTGGVAKKTILVAGGAGFLGSHLCERLIESGQRVICLDNLLTGSVENVAHLFSHPEFSFVRHDVTLPVWIDEPIDRIYNLACPASPPKYQSDPIATFKTSVVGAINLLDLARDKAARILQASTSEVYGDPEVSPQSEDYRGSVNTFGPRACYDEGKRAAETLFHDYARKYGLEIKIARIFNTYGPRMDPDDGRVVSNFIVQSLRGEDLTVFGTGAQTRSFCYVYDLISGLVDLMESAAPICWPVNLGNPIEITMLELAEQVLRKTKSNSGIRFCPLPEDDPRRRCPDITRARQFLRWEPRIAMEQGLTLTIAYFSDVVARRLGNIEKVS